MDEKWILLEQYISDIIQAENIAGAAVAVLQHGQVLYAKGLGVGNIDERQPVTPHTIFGVASVTKSFTALAIMKLAEEGKLSVNDAVVKHLSEFSLPG
ncbi:MAG: serine hydrolase domain-containing protein, partial [Bacillota bacterium]|nr:serine hydrolase domain-containing protein [Bacillota bacterium]